MDSDMSNSSLGKLFPGQNIVVHLLLLADLGFFITGITAPLLTLDKMFFWENTVTVISGIFNLITDGHWVLFLILFIFSLVLPVFKMVLILIVWDCYAVWNRFPGKLFRLMGSVSKWAMLDVFVVAVIVVSVKLKDVAEVHIHYGVYLFMISIFITLILTMIVEALGRKSEKLSVNSKPPVVNS